MDLKSAAAPVSEAQAAGASPATVSGFTQDIYKLHTEFI